MTKLNRFLGGCRVVGVEKWKTNRANLSRWVCIPKADGRQRRWALLTWRTKSFKGRAEGGVNAEESVRFENRVSRLFRL
jgi:hypothetical protein